MSDGVYDFGAGAPVRIGPAHGKVLRVHGPGDVTVRFRGDQQHVYLCSTRTRWTLPNGVKLTRIVKVVNPDG